jgi:hypothetical protein
MRIATQASIDLIAVRQSESTPRLRIIRLHCLDDPDLSTEQFNSRVFGGVQLFHFSINTAISCAPSGRFVRPLGGRGISLAKRRVDDHAPIGGAGAPPSQRPD